MAAKKKTTRSYSKKSTSTVNKTIKKVVKNASKTKSGRVGLVIGGILVGALVITFAFAPIFNGKTGLEIIQEMENENNKHSAVSTISFEGTVYDDFQIHFMELGNWNTGDSVYIKAGSTDILIDAGSKYNSAETIENFVDKYCTDGKLEYVIATHAHEDHIAGFSGGSSKNGIFYKYEVGTIIEFAKSENQTKEKPSQVYTNYVEARDYAVSKGAKKYTALEIYNNTSMRTISIGQDMTMTTLYQKYYEEEASTENNYSVCTLFKYKSHNFLFTGDLESPGESSLIAKNDIPQCDLYKAGHHGSKTSSSANFMAKVQPKVVCVCACAGSDEYTDVKDNQFPCQEFINRVGIYTSNIYVTSLSTDNEKKTFTSMNGYICFSSNGAEFSVSCSNNNTILKDTEWFKTNRTWPTN